MNSHGLQTLSQPPAHVKLVIHREADEILDRENSEILEIELLKKKYRGIGLSIVGKTCGPGIFISEVLKGKFLQT